MWHPPLQATAKVAVRGSCWEGLFATPTACWVESLQLRVLRLRLLQDGNIGVGIFPEGEEVQVRSLSLGSIALHGVGSCQLQTGQCTNWVADHDSRVIQDLAEFRRGLGALMCCEIRLASHKDRIERTEISMNPAALRTQFIGNRNLQQFDSPSRFPVVNCQ